MGTLYVTATPIGNLEDTTERALSTLKKVDGIICEDTRNTIKLLNKFKINNTLYSLHKSSETRKIKSLTKKLEKEDELALVSNAGTPCISDPGTRLIKNCRKKDIPVLPIPGPSAPTTAISVSGFPAQSFFFLGFIPKKDKKRKQKLKKLKRCPHTTCFFESPHRIIETLGELKQILSSERKIFAGREMTKKFESYYWGNCKTVLKAVKKDPQKGEYTIVISPKSKQKGQKKSPKK